MSVEFRGTTICAVKKKGITAVAGDGQVTMGESIVFKNNAVKVRRIYNGNVVIGRTWQEFMDCMKAVYKFFGLNDKKRLPIYVHNLPYDSQFFRKYFKWDKVFANPLRD